MTAREKAVTIFNMATQARRRIIYTIQIKIIVDSQPFIYSWVYKYVYAKVLAFFTPKCDFK